MNLAGVVRDDAVVLVTHRGLSRPSFASALAGVGAELSASFDITGSLF